MKKLTCEMCGSLDLVKQDGMFVCQNCGTKYSVEEAKKMMVEGTVEVQGTVVVDNSKDLDKLYQAARNARNANDGEAALKHYEKISALDPNSWEATFFSVLLKYDTYKNGEIELVATKIKSCLPAVFEMVKAHVAIDEDRKKAVETIYEECVSVTQGLICASTNFTKTINKTNKAMAFTGVVSAINSGVSSAKEVDKDRARCRHIATIMTDITELIKTNFGIEDDFYVEKINSAYMICLLLEKEFLKAHPKLGRFLYIDGERKEIINKIRETDPDTAQEMEQAKSNSTEGGCYVATCVYGSYDCPQVWTLRRYRDNTLGTTWYGRAFIKTYYAISPTLVKWFGETKWFKKMWKGKLDRMVKKLQDNGVESTPYNDKNW